MEAENVLRSLQNMVGDSTYATDDRAVRYSYSMHDFSPTTPKGMADFVVMPKTVEEVQDIIRFANKEKIPVTPVSGGLGLGLWLPRKGGILLDLRKMNKVLEINREASYAIIEPGVSLGILSGELERKAPELRATLPDPPYSASVLVNYINTGMTSSHSKYGIGQELILGLETVLPTGELVKTGSWCYPGITPHYRYIGPDLTGLFLSTYGTLGVVTKGAIKLLPKPETVKAKLIGYEDLESPIKDVRGLLRREIADRIFGHNWVLSYKAREAMPKEIKELIGKKPIPLELLNGWKENTGLPEVFFWVLLEGDPRIVEVKERMFDETVPKENQMEIDDYKDALPGEEEDLTGLAMGKPSTFYPQLYMGVSSSYSVVGTYHLMEAWPKIYDGWMKIGCSYGFPLQAGFKPYQHGRWTMTKFVVSHFSSENPEDCERVTSLTSHALTDYALNEVHQPEILQCVYPHVFRRCSHYELYKKIKNVLDPNGIMHPSLSW